MGKIFISYEEPETRYLYRMGDQSAHLFVLLARAAADFYNLSEPISSEHYADEYIVYEESFCKLVEIIFSHQRVLLYEWSIYAAPLYESIKGELYDWIWINEPLSPFRPVRMDYFCPSSHSGRSIGPAEA
jgi:hypothetical protein